MTKNNASETSTARPNVGKTPIRTGGTLVTPEQLAQQHQRFLAAATADNTRRTYRSAVRHFQAWGVCCPCNEATVVRYLLAFAEYLIRALTPRLRRQFR